jgi:hypothetical protein
MRPLREPARRNAKFMQVCESRDTKPLWRSPMYIHPRSSPADIREVIAAWLVCLAVAVAVLAYPGFFPEPARQAQADSRNAARAVSRTELCSVRVRQIAEPPG